jgi:hypothetical protein
LVKNVNPPASSTPLSRTKRFDGTPCGVAVASAIVSGMATFFLIARSNHLRNAAMGSGPRIGELEAALVLHAPASP